MRRIGVAVAVALLATAGLTACKDTSSSVNSSPDKSSSTAAGAAEKPGAAPGKAGSGKDKAGKAKPAAARIGDTITVHGMKDGSQLAVTLVKWVDPAKGSDEFTSPDAGKRFVAVQLRITNTGKGVYDDSPSNGVTLADTQGQQFDADFNEVSAGPSMAAEVKLQPGAKTLAYVVFQVPKASKAASLQFAMDSGFADEAGEWKIQ